MHADPCRTGSVLMRSTVRHCTVIQWALVADLLSFIQHCTAASTVKPYVPLHRCKLNGSSRPLQYTECGVCTQVMDALALGPVRRLAAVQGFTSMDEYSRDVAYSLLASMCDMDCRQGAQEVMGEMAAATLGPVQHAYQQCHQRLLATLATCEGAQQPGSSSHAAQQEQPAPEAAPAAAAAPGGRAGNTAHDASQAAGASPSLDPAVAAALQQRLPRLVPFHKATLLHMAYGLLLLLQFFETLSVLQPPLGLRMQLLSHMRCMAADMATMEAAGGGLEASTGAQAPDVAATAGSQPDHRAANVQQVSAARPKAAASGAAQRFAMLYICLVDACQRRSLLEAAVLLHSLAAWLAQLRQQQESSDQQLAAGSPAVRAAAGGALHVRSGDLDRLVGQAGDIVWPVLVSPCQASGKELAAGLLKVLAALRPALQQQVAAARCVMRLTGSDRLGLALLYVFAYDCCQRRCKDDARRIGGLLIASQ
jgi:hypothetical protein